MKRFIAVAIALFAGAANAEWKEPKVTGDGDPYVWSNTVNDTNLGYTCYVDKGYCEAMLKVKLTCDEKGIELPIFVVTQGDENAGAAHAIGTCEFTDDSGSLLAISLASDKTSSLIENHMMTQDSIAFVVPADSGGLSVSRFSLKGSKKAMDQVIKMSGLKETAPSGYVSPTQSGNF